MEPSVPQLPPPFPGRVGFSGTRGGMTDAQKEAVGSLLGHYVACEVHHGDCVGADADFHALATTRGYRTVGHPPEDDRLQAHCTFDESREPLGYHMRNRAIVDETEVLIATPKEQFADSTGGTWYTVHYASSVGRPVYVVRPDGRVEQRRPYGHGVDA